MNKKEFKAVVENGVREIREERARKPLAGQLDVSFMGGDGVDASTSKRMKTRRHKKGDE
jgi:hypothetical protein